MNVNPKTPGTDKLGEASAQWAEVNALTLKQNGEAVAPINSPVFTGTPTAPTPGSSDDSTKIATTAWVRDYAPLGNLASLNTVGAAQIDAGAVGATQLASTGVTAGSYSTANITVDADGRITAAANGTVAAGYTDEMAQDAVGGMLATTNSLTLSYTDGTPAITGDVRRKTTGLIAGSEGGIGEGSSGIYVNLGTTGETAAAGNDARFPTADQRAALSGTSGTVSSGNKFVTDADPRLPTTDENDALVGTAGSPGTANKFVTNSDGRLPSTDEKAAFVGTNGTPSSSNKFVTNSDGRLPSTDEKAAFAGTDGTPGAANPFVTDSDPRLVAATDASTLDGLDSTAFAILAGQLGGQTLTGGTASGNTLELKSTSNATKGGVQLATGDWLDVPEHASAPGTPASGKFRIYANTAGKVCGKNDAGTEYDLTTAAPWVEHAIMAQDWMPKTTAGCAALAQYESTGLDRNFKYLAFDGTTAEYADTNFVMPEDMDESAGIKVKLLWTPASSSGATVWLPVLSVLTNGTSLDTGQLVSTTLTSTSATALGLNIIAATAWSGTPALAGKLVNIQLSRSPSAGSDTLNAVDAWFFGLILKYKRTGAASNW